MNDTYDLIAIGAGPAGESATELAAFFGHRSLVIEKNKPGGTVTTTGGAPTKTLREAALYFSGLTDGEVYGLRMAAPPEVATETIRRRTIDVCKLLQKVTANNIAANGVDYIEGAARLAGGGKIIVGDRTLFAKTILIGTGSRPFHPPDIDFNTPGVCDTDTILLRGRVPRDIAIVGGGAVGVEFATICHALGARVTLLDLGSRLMTMMDGELSGAMASLFDKWGVAVVFNTTVKSVESVGTGLSLHLTNGNTISADTLLFAAGRVANTADLGLEAAGVNVDKRGRIIVDTNFSTTAPGIYAAGDVLGPTLASVAMEQGRVAVCHAFGIPFEGTADPTPVSAIYGMPEVSGAGMTEEQCKAAGTDYETGRADLALTPRGAIAGRGGLLKLIFLKRDRKLIGVHCIGDIASEIVGIGQMVIRCGGTLNTIANMSFNTPTYSYAYKYAAFDGLRRLAASGKSERVSVAKDDHNEERIRPHL
jgi:NAD(P) transhydrogenase